MAYITIQEAKEHLRVDHELDDIYIHDLLKVVEQAVALEIGEDLTSIEDSTGAIPVVLRHSMLLLLGHFYNVREATMIGTTIVEVPYAYKYLLAPFKNWTVR